MAAVAYLKVVVLREIAILLIPSLRKFSLRCFDRNPAYRWVNIAGKTAGSHVEVVRLYRRHWARYGLSVTPPRIEGGFLVEQPDSWSVKLSLLAAPANWHSKLEEVLKVMASEDSTRYPPGNTGPSVSASSSTRGRGMRRRPAGRSISMSSCRRGASRTRSTAAS